MKSVQAVFVSGLFLLIVIVGGPVTAALGVQCSYCHVMEPTRDLASDDKQAKKTARVMLQLVDHVNEMIEGGVGKPAAEVTKVQCATCHRGKAIPETPVLAPPPPPAPQAPR